MCVYVRESVCVYVRECVVWANVRESVCVKERERDLEKKLVCVCFDLVFKNEKKSEHKTVNLMVKTFPINSPV